MTLSSFARETVELVPGILEMNQNPEMTLFRITNWNLVHSDNVEGGIHVVMFLKRKIMCEMMTTYFPSLLLLMITFATTFFKPFFFEAALSVNLTTMLVMTTIFISKMESLPPTSTTKMIDYWLILCQLVPFAEVVLLTAMEYIREDNIGNDNMDGGVSCQLPVAPTRIYVSPPTPLQRKEDKEEELNKAKKSPPYSLLALKTIGEKNFSHFLTIFSVAETKGLPLCVLLCFAFYFGVAVKFYYE